MTDENKDTSANGGGTDTSAQKSAPANAGGSTTTTNANAGGDTGEVKMSSDALKKRLEEEGQRAVKKALRELGFDKIEDAQERIKKAKALEDEKLSADEKREKRIKELEPQAARAAALEERLKKDVEARFAALPEDVQKRIDAKADGDWEKRSDFMDVLGPVPAATADKGADAKDGKGESKAKPALANTTKTAPAPKDVEGPTPWEKWQSIKTTNPTLAGLFYQANQVAVDRSAPTD